MCINFPNSILEYFESKHNTKASQNLNDDQYMKKTTKQNKTTTTLVYF